MVPPFETPVRRTGLECPPMRSAGVQHEQRLVEKSLPKPLAEYARVRMPADHALSEAYGAALERTDTLSGSDYPSKVGALIYGVPCGRIDVAYVVGILARCLTFPTATLSAAAERVLVYLGQHAGDGLTYDGTVPGADVLVGYSDSSWSVGHSTTVRMAGVDHGLGQHERRSETTAR